MKAVTATILIFASLAWIEADQSGYSIKPIPQTGVLFEHLGEAHFYTKHWTILSKLKMPDLTEDLKFVNNCSSLITRLCAEVTDIGVVPRCKVAVKEMRSWVEKIKRQNEELLHHTHEESSRRSKRSIFDGIGSVAKTLFGTMDHADSEEIHAAIDDLNAQEDRTFNLLKDQITVVKSTFDLFNASRLQAAEEREEILNRVSTIVKAQEGQYRELSSLQLRMELSEVITLMTLHLREVSEMQETMTSILVSLSVGKLHPLIIHAREMSEIMRNASRQMDLEEKFQNFQLLVQIAKVQALQVNQEILVRVEIPQPQRVAFDLHKVYTIPIAIDEFGYHVYDLDAEFVAANNHERQYVLLSYQQYQECQRLVTTADHPQVLCPQLGPTITAIGENCVLNLFRSFNVNTKACKERVTAKWSSLVRMVTRNHWLFMMSEKTKLEVNCQHSPTSIGELEFTGVLFIKEHCHLQIGDLRIAAEDDAQRNISLWQPGRLELPAWNSIATKPDKRREEVVAGKTGEIRLLAADNFNLAWRDQDAAIKKVQDAITQEETSRHIISHPVHLAATSSIGCLAIITLAILTGVVCYLKRWKRKQTQASTKRPMILPIIQRKERQSEDRGANANIETILPTTVNLPTTNLPTIVKKQIVQLE